MKSYRLIDVIVLKQTAIAALSLKP